MGVQAEREAPAVEEAAQSGTEGAAKAKRRQSRPLGMDIHFGEGVVERLT